MPGIYSDSDYDLAGFAVGVVERSGLLPKLENVKPGDKIIGLVSSGLHSNGYSLVRKIVSSFCLNDPCPFGSGKETLGKWRNGNLSLILYLYRKHYFGSNYTLCQTDPEIAP